MQEIGHPFSQIYNQALRDENQEENVAVEYCNVLDEDVKEELIEEKKAEMCLKTIEIDSEGSTDKRYNCDYCDFNSHRKDTLSQHKKRKHTDNLQIYDCDSCDYRSRRKDAISQHMKRKHAKQEHLSIYTCENCSYTSNVTFNLAT